MWTAAGIVLALGLAIAAWWRGRVGSGYYDGELYGMTPAVHRRYGVAGLLLALICALSLVWQALAIPALAAVVVVTIVYATSFLRGAADDA